MVLNGQELLREIHTFRLKVSRLSLTAGTSINIFDLLGHDMIVAHNKTFSLHAARDFNLPLLT
jgi:hypothetical protein